MKIRYNYLTNRPGEIYEVPEAEALKEIEMGRAELVVEMPVVKIRESKILAEDKTSEDAPKKRRKKEN